MILPVFKYLNYSAHQSNMVADDPFKGPSFVLITCKKKYLFRPNAVNKYLPKIISYLPLEDSST